jgi:tetratricopeptide (TPR) repeat protein
LQYPLWVVGLGPLALLILALQKQLSLTRQRMGQRLSMRLLVVFGAVLGAILITVLVVILVLVEEDSTANSSRKPFDFVSIVTAVMFCFLCLSLLVTRKKRKLLREVAIALQVHDFRRALELCAAAPKVVRRAHLLRYQQAIAHAVSGNREAAIALLERLWSDKPRFPLSALALGELLLDTDRAERAAEIAKSVAPRLRRDPAPPLLEARGMRRLGRIDEAQAACDRALAIDPDNGSVNAVAAALALDRGETERAQALMERALELAPGDAYLLVVRAEIALQGDADEQARLAVSLAVEAIRANPLVFLQVETKRLESALAERLQPVVTENIFIE